MSKEQYVTFDVAKLLKEKGFDWEVRSLYGKDGDMGFSSWSNNYNAHDDLVSAPTQQMACRWLREERGYTFTQYLSQDSIMSFPPMLRKETKHTTE